MFKQPSDTTRDNAKRRDELRKFRAAHRAAEKQRGLPILSEIDTAHNKLTREQKSMIGLSYRNGLGVSEIARKLGLTRSFVHSEIRMLNKFAKG